MPSHLYFYSCPLFKIHFQIENGNLWICIMSFFNERNIEFYSRRCIATNADEGWTNRLQFEEILQIYYLILKTIIILILPPNFSISFKYLMLKFRVHIELQTLRRKHPELKTLNFSEVCSMYTTRCCFFYWEIPFKTTWKHLISSEDLSILFYCSKMSYKLKEKKSCVLYLPFPIGSQDL